MWVAAARLMAAQKSCTYGCVWRLSMILPASVGGEMLDLGGVFGARRF